MAIALRLSRGGAKKRPYYRIVAADSRKPRDGKYLEQIGIYNPSGDKVGEVSHLRNKEFLYVVTEDPAGASLMFATEIVNESEALAPDSSVAVITMLWSPTSLSPGVPDRIPVEVSNAIQDGTVVPAKV